MAAVVDGDGGVLQSLVRRLRHGQPGNPPLEAGSRVECEALIHIPGDRVAEALTILADTHPEVRRFTIGRQETVYQRIRLRDAFKKLGHDAQRSLHDNGIVVTGASGTEADLKEIYGRLGRAHCIAAGSYLRLSSGHLAFPEDGLPELRQGMPTDVLTGAQAPFGVA